MQCNTLSSQLSAAATMLAVVCALATGSFGQSNNNITVTSPLSNSTVSMPVQVAATFAGCGGASSGFGYSVGSSPFITWGSSETQINNTDYRLTPGTYPVIHFKGWSGNTLCETDITNVTVTGPATTTVPNIELNTSYKWVSDSGTGGTASGTTQIVSGSPCQDSECREFTMTYSNGGGMRWSTSFGSDTGDQVTHFVYDTYIYFTGDQDVENVEMDTNQVWDSAGDVLIFGTQCAGTDGKWQYTTNSGGDKWNDSAVTCTLSKYWKTDYWHHVQIAVHRVGAIAYYDTVTFDGTTYTLNDSGNSSFDLAWALGDLVLNFQIDGSGSSGSVPAFYVDGLTEIYW